jgi:hypothetical protein
MKTYTPKAPDIQRRWWLVDAENKVLGRLASEVAQLLRGKHKPMYTPHLDTGDFVVVINADKVRLTGDKAETEDVLPSLGLHGRREVHPVPDDAGEAPGAGDRAGGEGHAAEEQPGPPDAAQAEGVRGSGASARGAAAGSIEI